METIDIKIELSGKIKDQGVVKYVDTQVYILNKKGKFIPNCHNQVLKLYGSKFPKNRYKMCFGLRPTSIGKTG